MEVRTVLNEEIEAVAKRLKELEIGSPEYEVAAKTWASLMDRAIEFESKDVDASLKKSQAKFDRVDRIISHVIDIGSIAGPLAVTVWGTLKTLKFEETGVITSLMTRGFLNKLLPKK